MSQIFLSYAREDLQSVKAIYKLLTKNGLSVWIDEEDLLPGQDWRFEISRLIPNCSIFLACLSNKSVSKEGYVQKELRIAYEVLDMLPEGRVFIIPLRLDDCPLPSRLQSIHRLDFFEPNGKEKLLKTIFAHLKPHSI